MICGNFCFGGERRRWQSDGRRLGGHDFVVCGRFGRRQPLELVIAIAEVDEAPTHEGNLPRAQRIDLATARETRVRRRRAHHTVAVVLAVGFEAISTSTSRTTATPSSS